MVVLDTNIFIDHLRQRGRARTVLDGLMETYGREALSLSLISIQELFEGKSVASKDEESRMLAVIAPLTILPYTFEVAQKAGEIARFPKTGVEFEDAAIAATAIVNGYKLYTLNTKYFKDIKDLELL